MNDDKTLYKDDSIESLDPRTFTRLKPGIYCGSTETSTQLLIEVVANSVDEFAIGHGSLIDVTIDKDVFTVRDFAQGFPVNVVRDDGKTVLEAAFSVLNTSGKYHADTSVYEGTSLGSYGIGSKITNFLSHECIVTTYRGGKFETVSFVEGLFAGRQTGNATEHDGTIVSWRPSEEFFTSTGVDRAAVRKLFRTITCLCSGLAITLTIDGKAERFFSKNGLNDLVDEGVGKDEISKRRLVMNWAEGKNKLDLVMTYTSRYSSTIVPFVNIGATETGPHITQIKTTLTREMNKFFREKGWLKDKDGNLSGDDCQEGMYLVFNITAQDVGYDAQVKSRISKLDMKPFTGAFARALQVWLLTNEKDVRVIFDKAINARKAKEAAKKARDAVRDGKTKDKKKRLLNLPTKLVDANAKNRSLCEMFVVEGDSAAGGLVKGRNSEFQAVFPIRGKIINVYKASTEKIFNNQEVTNIIKAIGLEFDKSGKLIYDSKKLRYGKIIMACDADADGQAIKNLLITLFWWLCPDIIINGHLYAAVPPLFRITTSKNQYIFLKDQKELDTYKAEHTNSRFIVSRNKGLGEQDHDELSECLLEPTSRNVVQITVEDVEAANNLLETLMGSSVPPRRAWLLEHSEEARGDVI